jgi:hypothetical protein
MLPFLLLGIAAVLGDPASSCLNDLVVIGPLYTFAGWPSMKTFGVLEPIVLASALDAEGSLVLIGQGKRVTQSVEGVF